MKFGIRWLITFLLVISLDWPGLAQQLLTVPKDYPTIQRAIDVANPEDTVLIRAGIYRENLTIEKPLRLVGENYLTVWIEAADLEKPVILVNLKVGEVTISGLTVQGGEIGFLLRVALEARATIDHVCAVGNRLGVMCWGAGAVVVRHSLLVDNKYGLYTNARATGLLGVEISRGMVGIILDGIGWTTIQECLVGFAEHAIDTYTTGCGYGNGAQAFKGIVQGKGNRVFGLKTNLCPPWSGEPWPEGFLNEAWQRAVDEAVADFKRGVHADENQDYLLAVKAYEEGLGKLRDAPFPLLEAYFHQCLGIAYYELGRYPEALRQDEVAREVYLSLGMIVKVAEVDVNMGNVYYRLGRYEEALLKYTMARKVFCAQRMIVEVADVDVNMGNVYYELGRYEEALERYRAAREVYVAQEMWVEVADVDVNMGNVYRELGRYEEALQKYEAARGVFASQGMTLGVAGVEMNIANVYCILGQYRESLVKYAAAREIFLAQGMRVKVAKVDVNMGNVYHELGWYEEALERYRAAWEVYLAQGMTVDVAGVDMNMGAVYDDLGRYEEALTKYKEALEGLDRIPPLPGMAYSCPAERWMIHNNRGVAFEGLKRYEEAIAAYQEALAVIESIRGFLRTEELKAAWGERTRDVYERLIDLLYRLGQGAQAFPYTERCRARTFLDLLYQGGVKPEQFLGPEQGVVAGAVDPQAIERAITQALKSLKPNEVVLSYFVTDRGIYIWVIAWDKGMGTHVIQSPRFISYPRAQLQQDVIRLRQALERRDPVDEGLSSFYTKLLFPEVLGEFPPGVDTLILIPSGPLWYLPFAALARVVPSPTGSLATSYRYLVEDYVVVYSPSLASLAVARGEVPPTHTVLGLANPTRSGETGVEAQQYPMLEEAVQGFARCYAGEARVYVREEAQETLAHREAQGNTVLAYACHGQFNPRVPLQSKLLLAPAAEPTRTAGDPRIPDGDYHAWEVLLTDHRGVDLVILAACETLLPAFRHLQETVGVLAGTAPEDAPLTSEQLEQITSGDEVVGLVRAFLSTGAQSVLATLWQANPAAVETLFVKLAEHRLEGKSWAQALAYAQRELLQSAAFAHPWFWAPYQLVGRW